MDMCHCSLLYPQFFEGKGLAASSLFSSDYYLASCIWLLISMQNSGFCLVQMGVCLLQKTASCKAPILWCAPKHLICLDISLTEIHMTDKESLEDALALCQTDIKTINYAALGFEHTQSQRTRLRWDASEKRWGSCAGEIPWKHQGLW